MVKWRRSFPDTSHDFTAYDGEITVGRIYRHWDEKRWQWFFQLIPASSGCGNSRQEAIDALIQAYEAWKALDAQKRPPPG